MSRRTDTMQQVAGLAGDSADTQMRELADRQKSLSEGEAQLAELQRFLREYQHTDPQASLSMTQLMNRQQFLQRIKDAIVFQQGAVERLRVSLEDQRQRWMQARNRAKALDSVAQRMEAGDNRASERHEQSEADERAQRSTSIWDTD